MPKINQQELARRLNLSQTTVSRSLANHPAINPETKAMVMEAAAKLGYKQRIHRRKVPVHGQQIVLGVIISTQKDWSGPPETFQEILQGIADKSSLHTTTLDIISHEPSDKSGKLLIQRIRNSGWKGCILIYPLNIGIVRDLSRMVSCVSIVENYRQNQIDCIDVDQADGILTIVRHLKEQGHRKIGFVSWCYDVETPWVTHRYASYVAGLVSCGMEPDSRYCINVRQGERLDRIQIGERVAQWIREGVTAVVCPADHQAYTLMDSLAELGYRVPEDISLTGFDGIPPPGGAAQICTVKVPNEELGRSAVHQLLRRIEQPGAPRRHILVDGKVLQGASVRNINAASGQL